MINNQKYYKSVIQMKNKGVRIPASSHQFDFKQDIVGNVEFYNSTYARSCRGIFNDNHTVSFLSMALISLNSKNFNFRFLQILSAGVTSYLIYDFLFVMYFVFVQQ